MLPGCGAGKLLGTAAEGQVRPYDGRLVGVSATRRSGIDQAVSSHAPDTSGSSLNMRQAQAALHMSDLPARRCDDSFYGRTTRLRSPSNINDVVPVAFLVLSHRPSLCQHGLMTDCGQSCSIPEHIHQFLVSRWWFGGRQLSWRWTPLKQEPQRQDQEQLALQVAVARVLRVARLLFLYDGILCVLGLPRCFHQPPFRTEPPGSQKQAAGKVVKCVA